MKNTTKADSFAALVRMEYEALVEQFLADGSQVQSLLKRAELNANQQLLVAKALGTAVSDTLYTLLLALDGEASIGGIQQQYKVLDESGEALYEPGELEAAAWRHFQQHDNQGNKP